MTECTCRDQNDFNDSFKDAEIGISFGGCANGIMIYCNSRHLKQTIIKRFKIDMPWDNKKKVIEFLTSNLSAPLEELLQEVLNER